MIACLVLTVRTPPECRSEQATQTQNPTVELMRRGCGGATRIDNSGNDFMPLVQRFVMLRLITGVLTCGACTLQERGHFVPPTTLNVEIIIAMIDGVGFAERHISAVAKAISG